MGLHRILEIIITANIRDVFIYAQKDTGYIQRDKITVNPKWIDQYKLFVPEAIGAGDVKTDWIKPIKGEPNTCCTETYVVIGPFGSREEMDNAYSYTQTRFFHLMLTLKKNTQHTSPLCICTRSTAGFFMSMERR